MRGGYRAQLFKEKRGANRSPIEILYEERNKVANWGTETVSFELPDSRPTVLAL